MNSYSSEKVLLDACVIYPAPIRDFLLNLADQKLFQPKWSELIQDEWKRNLLKNRPDLKDWKLTKTISLMNRAFPDPNVDGFDQLVKTISLPDPDDRHVLAAAIHSQSKKIVTFNLKDFPKKTLAEFGIKAVNPDNYIWELIELDIETCKSAFENQLRSLRNPPKTKAELLEILKNCGLKKSTKLMK